MQDLIEQLKIGYCGKDANAENHSLLQYDSFVNFNYSPMPFVPWHWHNAIEIFYVESGCFEYSTIHGNKTFQAGSGGFINAGVIHSFRWKDSENSNILSIYKFDSSLLVDKTDDDVNALLGSKVELIPFYINDCRYHPVLETLKKLSNVLVCEEDRDGILHNVLTLIVDSIITFEAPFSPQDKIDKRTNIKLKAMMSYIHQNYQKPFQLKHIAQQGQLSYYSCHRFFREKLITTPIDFANEVRLFIACILLATTNEYIGTVALYCGFCTSSYFGKLFKEKFRCTPMEYRLAKQCDISENKI